MGQLQRGRVVLVECVQKYGRVQLYSWEAHDRDELWRLMQYACVLAEGRTNTNLRSAEWLELYVGWLLRRVHKRTLQSIEVVGSDRDECALATDVLMKFLLQINERIVRVLVQCDTTQHRSNDKRPYGLRLYSRRCTHTTTIHKICVSLESDVH